MLPHLYREGVFACLHHPYTREQSAANGESFSAMLRVALAQAECSLQKRLGGGAAICEHLRRQKDVAKARARGSRGTAGCFCPMGWKINVQSRHSGETRAFPECGNSVEGPLTFCDRVRSPCVGWFSFEARVEAAAAQETAALEAKFRAFLWKVHVRRKASTCHARMSDSAAAYR